MAIDVTSFSLYKWRYFIGYGVVIAALIGLLVVAGLYSPGGISKNEEASIIISSNINLNDLSSVGIINAPYYIFQNQLMSVFGMNQFTVKLASLIIGIFSSIGLILLLWKWFKNHIAVLASLIAITTGQLLFLSQSGSPNIMYVFWAAWLLLLATLVAKQARFMNFYKIAFFIFAALSLYTPFSIYIIAALILNAFLHPHLRFITRNLSRWQLVAGAAVGLILLIPLFYKIIISPSIALTLMGIPSSMPDILDNLSQLGQIYFGFANPTSGALMTPVFGMGSIALIFIGLNNIIKTRETTQSYLILALIVCIVPVIIINPSLTAITLLPMVLLLAAGLDSLISYWYRLFPRNPYARVAGLLPIGILILALSFSGLERYFYGYHYNPDTASSFSQDLALIPKDTQYIMVSDSELDLYKAVGRYNKNIVVVTSPSGSETIVVTRQAVGSGVDGYKLDKVITSSRANDSDRYYIYKKIAT